MKSVMELLNVICFAIYKVLMLKASDMAVKYANGELCPHKSRYHVELYSNLLVQMG